jgi:hypothetical protein
MSESAGKRLAEVRSILLRRGLIDADEELCEAMLEDLVHFAYVTGCIPKKDVQRFLGLSEEQATEKLRAWKRWQEGNRSCTLRHNPFSEGWSVAPGRSRDGREGAAT